MRGWPRVGQQVGHGRHQRERPGDWRGRRQEGSELGTNRKSWRALVIDGTAANNKNDRNKNNSGLRFYSAAKYVTELTSSPCALVSPTENGSNHVLAPIFILITRN